MKLSSLTILMVLSAVILTCSGKVIFSANIETLKLAHVIFRHGSRSPLTSYHRDPYNNSIYWPDGLGQLTATGKQQEYELGQYLRWRYMKFIDHVYRPSDVYAKSSDIDRSIMSGELVLAGMFPPTSDSPSSMWNPRVYWQPIPIHTLPAGEDNVMTASYARSWKIAFTAKCPEYEHLFYTYLQSPQMQVLNNKYSYMYEYLTEYSKTNISNVLAASDLYDVLYVQEAHNLTLPEWAHRYYPEKLRSATEDLWDNLVATQELKRLRGGPLLGEILLNIEQLVFENKRQVNPNPKAKLYLYSGHDSTIATLLGTLGVFDRQVPPYSSAVIFELHQERMFDGTVGDYFVKVFFRNETTRAPYDLQIPNCGDPCLLQSFKRLMEDITIMDWGTWNQEYFTIVVLVLFLAGLIVAALAFVTMLLIRRSTVNSGNYENNASTMASP